MNVKAQAKKTKKKVKRVVNTGRVYVNATFNNTLVYITDQEGNVLSWATAGGQGFKGSRKSTPFAAGEAAKKAATEVVSVYSMKAVDVFVKGPGPGREAAVRALATVGLKVLSITDVTGIPHNGCRGEKERRV